MFDDRTRIPTPAKEAGMGRAREDCSAMKKRRGGPAAATIRLDVKDGIGHPPPRLRAIMPGHGWSE